MTPTPHIANRLLPLAVVLHAVLWPAAAFAAESTQLTFASTCRSVEGMAATGFGGPLPDAEELVQLREDDGVACADFTVLDPTSLQTGVLHSGQSLTVVITVRNPERLPVSRVRAWVAYDPAVLEGNALTVDPGFPVTTPGEAGFFPQEGYGKVHVSTATPRTDEEFAVATMTFTVRQTALEKTVISFFDPGTDAAKHTLIAMQRGTAEEFVSGPTPGALIVRIAQAPAASSAVSAETVMEQTVSGPPAAPSSAPPSSAADLKPAASSVSSGTGAARRAGIFPDYQVENLRVTTQGTTAYLGWDILASGELAGYNVYYGATSGQYLHRKTIDKSETTLAVRGLPEGTPYYFAVRGVNAAGVETEFSREVSVVIGKPQTSTAPLSASMIGVIGGKTDMKTDGEVKGETGMASSLAAILAACALVGTLVAARRQTAVLTEPVHAA